MKVETYVETTRGDVGDYKNRTNARSELGGVDFTCSLVHGTKDARYAAVCTREETFEVSVARRGVRRGGVQQQQQREEVSLGRALDVMLCRREDDAARGSRNVLFEQKQQSSIFFIIPAPNESHLQLIADFILRIQTDDLGVLESSSCELSDGGGHGGRKEQCLSAWVRHLLEDIAYLG
jgi:hypothetical protein